MFRVLVVEDEGMVNRLYSQALEQNGFSVHQVATGEEAVEVSLRQNFDVAVIDLRLPGKLDGLTTFRVLKTLMPGLKGIIVTGYGNRQRLIEAIKLGVDGWLEKPVTVSELIEAVKRAISSKVERISQEDLLLLSTSDKSALLNLFLKLVMATTVSDVGILWLIDKIDKTVYPQIVVGDEFSSIPSVPYTLSSEWLVELRGKMEELIPSPCLIVPIKWQKEIIGAAGLCRHKFYPVPYSQLDLQYLERFAEWLAPILLTWLYPQEVLMNFTTILETMVGFLHSKIDPMEEQHPKRLRIIVRKLGKNLGLSLHQIASLELAAIMHDLGKIFLPPQIISKPDRLTDEERSIIQKHPVYGEKLLCQWGLPENIALWVRWHHERYNGNGYPDQKRSDEIPLEAQIIAVAEALDTLLSPRPYKPSLSFEEALNCICQEQGKQFSPVVVEALKEVYEELKEALECKPSESEKGIIASA